MSWTQVSSTRYERPFDTIETFYRAIAAAGAPLNKEHYLITCTARLQAPLPPASAVEQALSTPRNVFRFLPAYVEPDPLEGASHPELSSMGRVNDTLTAEEVRGRVRTVRVTTWWVAVEVINRLLLTNVWTWEERMVLSVNWNEAFYAPELVEGLLGAWREELVRGLLAG
ncbi:hypothetical protein BO86DRAFT_403595 [Aspergillus japonicus CBS 114.51]|uniref:Uncharacterized protein n=1 Tax=Aspergillus japonicus CBS 114.51 TaxID=1448312 RepID=A0A8T8WP27_ASPJA|nr:hypothetical protein BO86DRAFT_403595 [Aspergillus japonicus CBS 114.51]RAH77595.1 hypothetical protein BO86DRAFT_403595 [Aspergillus japonicus CBS 114.51]